jgi:2-polyprenyl-3-methyl-5-hydroxy-6-metoxy-1,4-benzoquinol methylase
MKVESQQITATARDPVAGTRPTGGAIACPLCGSGKVAHHASYARVNQELYKCGGCGLYFVFPHTSYLPPDTGDPERDEFWSTPAAHRAYQRWREAENDRIRTFIVHWLPQRRPIRLLEIGFGEGPLTELLLEHVDEYWGIEPVPATFQKTASRLNLDPSRTSCIRAEEIDDDRTYAGLSGAFDVIVMVSVLEHLSNPGRILASCRRLLRPGGRLVISTPDSSYFRALHALRRLAGLEPWSYFHISFFNRRNLEAAFARHGFKVVKQSVGQLVTPESIEYYREYTGSRMVALVMSAFRQMQVDRALRIQTLLYLLERQE